MSYSTDSMKRCAFRTGICAVEGMDSDLDAAHSLAMREQTLPDYQMAVTRFDVPPVRTHADVRFNEAVASVLRVLPLERGTRRPTSVGAGPRA